MTAHRPPESLPPATVQDANQPPAPPAQVPIVSVPGPLDCNPAAVYLAGKASEAGRRGLRRSLDRAAEILTGGVTGNALLVRWQQVRYQHVAALRAKMIDAEVKPATINHTLAAVRGTIREAWHLELIDAETMARLVRVPNVKSETVPAGRHLKPGEIIRLFDACAATPVGARDTAMLTLLYGCGMRRSEAVSVELADYVDGALTIRRGKGRKERYAYFPDGGQEAIDAWIEHRGTWPGTLLCPVKKGGHVEQRSMTAQAVLMRLRFLASLARVPRFTPHDLRRTFVGELLSKGADISSVQQLAGHASVTTTTRYDRRGEDAKRNAASLLPFPYSKPLLVGGPAADARVDAAPNDAEQAAATGGEPDPAGEPG
ncbi:MAG: tyrosine-type recombinase/integrase [Deltaproteobacteria bacterium]|nr:tyrosine-type recombinase/integrase [Deltaproteobacteria bacterium]